MPLPDLIAIPIADLMDPNSHLYLWTTNSMMVEAHQLARAWGFEPKTVITWVKVRADGSGAPSMKMGFYYRSATEHCLFCVRGRIRLSGPPRPTCFLHPRLPHSVKPDTMHQWAEEQSPADHVELFARRERDGWVTIGKEIGTWLW
jgi:N6-adenosine-specific RNA methylase IME4